MSSWQAPPFVYGAAGFAARVAELDGTNLCLYRDRSVLLSISTYCGGGARMSTATIRRGAPRRGEPSARERLIKTATELFYQEGIRAIGIDTVVARSGVSKSSLYRTFASKEKLIAAFAEEQNRRFWQWWDETTARHIGGPRRQIEALFEAIPEQL